MCLWVRECPVYQGFSNFNAHPNQLGIWLTCKSWYHRGGGSSFEPCLVILMVPGLGLCFEQQGCRLTSLLKNKGRVEGAFHGTPAWLCGSATEHRPFPVCQPVGLGSWVEGKAFPGVHGGQNNSSSCLSCHLFQRTKSPCVPLGCH